MSKQFKIVPQSYDILILQVFVHFINHCLRFIILSIYLLFAYINIYNFILEHKHICWLKRKTMLSCDNIIAENYQPIEVAVIRIVCVSSHWSLTSQEGATGENRNSPDSGYNAKIFRGHFKHMSIQTNEVYNFDAIFFWCVAKDGYSTLVPNLYYLSPSKLFWNINVHF